MVYKVRIYGDPALRENTEIVAAFNKNLNDLVDSMIETMYEDNGIGLAAPQIGIFKKIAVIDLSFGEEVGNVMTLINPEILKTEGECSLEEGCLSVPGIYEEVLRSDNIRVRYQDFDGNELEKDVDGLLARIIQHESDHLEGVLFVDRLSTVKRNLLAKTLRSLAEGGCGD